MNVIFTVAFGKAEYFRLAELLFESLHRVGSTARRVCITDREHQFPAHLNVSCVVAPKAVSMKARAPALLGLKSGDYCMMVDSDILFARNPDFLFAGDRVRVSTTAIPLAATQFDFNQAFLTREEVQGIPMSRPCINTGLMVFPGAVAAEFAERWADFHQQVRGEAGDEYVCLQDQPALEALLVRGALQADFLPTTMMHFPAGTSRAPVPDCVVLHFTGYPRNQAGKTKILARMTAALKEISA